MKKASLKRKRARWSLVGLLGLVLCWGGSGCEMYAYECRSQEDCSLSQVCEKGKCKEVSGKTCEHKSGAYPWACSLLPTDANVSTRVAVDSKGFTYLGGRFSGATKLGNTALTAVGSYDIWLAKLSPNGKVIWATSAGGGGVDVVGGITLDAAGNIYVAGDFEGRATLGSTTLSSKGSNDVFVAKLDNKGKFLWAKAFGGKNIQYGSGVCVDPNGNIYLSGSNYGTVRMDSSTLNTQGLRDGFVAKLDPSGKVVWATSTSSGDMDSQVGPYNLVLDGKGNLYFSGLFSGTTQFGPYSLTTKSRHSAFVTKLDSKGQFLWATGGGGSGMDAATQLAVDGAGNVFVGGSFVKSATFGSFSLTSKGIDDLFVAKLNSSGKFVWVAQGGGDSNELWHDNAGGGLALDRKGNIYVSGSFLDNVAFDLTKLSGERDVFVAKLSPAGKFVWAVHGGGSGKDYPYSMVLDSAGILHITGLFTGSATFSGTTIRSSTPGGQDVFLWKLPIPPSRTSP